MEPGDLWNIANLARELGRSQSWVRRRFLNGTLPDPVGYSKAWGTPIWSDAQVKAIKRGYYRNEIR